MALIDKETIRAEIERRYAEYSAKMKTDDLIFYEGMADALDLFEQFLDTLPDEHEPNFDLIKKSWYTEGYQDALYRLEPIWIIRDLKYVENPKCGQPLPKRPVECLADSGKTLEQPASEGLEVDLEKLGEIARHIIAVKQNVEDMRLSEDEWSLLERIGYPQKLNARKED